MSLGDMALWVEAWNAAHADGHQLTIDEELDLVAMLETMPVQGHA